MADIKNNSNQTFSANYLCQINNVSPIKIDQFYNFAQEKKNQYGLVRGGQSHAIRRKMILDKYPEVAQLLQSTKPYTIIIALILIPFGMYVPYAVKDASWPVFLSAAYIMAATCGHTLQVLVHQFTHLSGHTNMTLNKVFAVLCNMPMGLPTAISFGKYHSDHHNYMGQAVKDPDLPVKIQSTLSKFVPFKIFFYFFVPFFYVIRPLLFLNKKVLPGQIMNIAFIILMDVLVYKFWGSGALLFLFMIAMLSIGPHPAAAHVVAQHFEFVTGLQTYDYFGFWNIPNLNLGYHIEHHDFPTCPWYNLPKIRATAPEFYVNLPYHTSYLKVIYRFLFDNNFNLFNRTLRTDKKE